jgi:hypothetical protein
VAAAADSLPPLTAVEDWGATDHWADEPEVAAADRAAFDDPFREDWPFWAGGDGDSEPAGAGPSLAGFGGVGEGGPEVGPGPGWQTAW